MCDCPGGRHCQCEAIRAYASHCARAGVKVRWSLIDPECRREYCQSKVKVYMDAEKLYRVIMNDSNSNGGTIAHRVRRRPRMWEVRDSNPAWVEKKVSVENSLEVINIRTKRFKTDCRATPASRVEKPTPSLLGCDNKLWCPVCNLCSLKIPWQFKIDTSRQISPLSG